MPEEINRIVTDAIADLLWAPSPDADENLKSEGVPDNKIDRIGNIMIDSFELLRSKIEADDSRTRFGLKPQAYGVVTLHRPANVDHIETLAVLVDQLKRAAATPLWKSRNIARLRDRRRRIRGDRKISKPTILRRLLRPMDQPQSRALIQRSLGRVGLMGGAYIRVDPYYLVRTTQEIGHHAEAIRVVPRQRVLVT